MKGGIAMELPRLGLAVALLTIGAGSQALAAGDQARGQNLFSSRCGACHALNALADPHISLAISRPRGKISVLTTALKVAQPGRQ